MKKILHKWNLYFLAVLLVFAIIPSTTGNAAEINRTVSMSPGTYLVPLSLKSTANPDRRSLAHDCFAPYGVLTVDENGTAVLEADLRCTSIGTAKECIDQIKIYPDNSTDGHPSDAQIMATQTVSVTNGIHTSQRTVPSKISFAVPKESILSNGIYISIHLDLLSLTTDGFLSVDYAKAMPVSDESLNYTCNGSVRVSPPEAGSYTINTTVVVTNGRISNFLVAGSDYTSESAIPANESFLSMARSQFWDKLTGIFHTDIQGIDSLDAVTRATASSEGIKESVKQALQLSYPDRKPLPAPDIKNLREGSYHVQLQEYMDITDLPLYGTSDLTGILHVNSDGTMTLTYEPVSGLSPYFFYIRNFHGYYKKNDVSSSYTMTGAAIQTGTFDNAAIVTRIQIPLMELSSVYRNHLSLYTPNLKELNDTISGISFHSGNFDTDTLLTVNWDTLEAIQEDKPVTPSQPNDDHKPVAPPQPNDDHKPVTPSQPNDDHKPVTPSQPNDDHKPVTPPQSNDDKEPVKPSKPIAPPFTLKASGHSANAVRLQWNRIADAKGYTLYLYNPKTKKYIALATVKGNTTTYTVKKTGASKKAKKLIPGTAYKFRIRSFVFVNNRKTYKNTASLTTATTPSRASLSRVKRISSKKVKLCWKKVKNANGYDIWMKTGKSNYKRMKLIQNGKTTKYTVSGLKKGRTYVFKIRAYKTIKTVKNGKVFGTFSKVKKLSK